MMSWMRCNATRSRDTFRIHELRAAPISQRVPERGAQSVRPCDSIRVGVMYGGSLLLVPLFQAKQPFQGAITNS
jgi:hypothetical protein